MIDADMLLSGAIIRSRYTINRNMSPGVVEEVDTTSRKTKTSIIPKASDVANVFNNALHILI